MIKFVSLFSGSSGNSYFLQVDKNKFLVDVGVSKNKIVESLKHIDEDISNIDGILITHEHIDHIRGLSLLNKKYSIPIYINEKTLIEVKKKIELLDNETINIFSNKEFKINETIIKPFSIPHDASDPVGFSFFDKDNKKITIVTDLGEITEEVYENLLNNDFLVIEANYDEDLIRYSSYPISLISRIVSSGGHLSNSESLNLVSHLVDNGLKKVALAHISRSNNNFEIVSQKFEDVINGKKEKNQKVEIYVLRHDKNGNEIVI